MGRLVARIFSLILPSILQGPNLPLLGVVGAADDPRGQRELGIPGPELEQHVLVDAQIIHLVEVIRSLGEERIQLVPRVRRLRLVVGRGANQGFNVGHKVLGGVLRYEILGSATESLEAATAGKSDMMILSTSSMDFGA